MDYTLVVCGLIENREGEFLLVRERLGSYQDSLKFPTETVELGESYQDTLVRGIDEETGFSISDIVLWSQHLATSRTGNQLLIRNFHAQLSGGSFQPSDEISEAVWASMNYLSNVQYSQRDFPHNRQVEMIRKMKGF